jgi:predicted AlkP superfamily phosphohydrolase/phosphomutase
MNAAGLQDLKKELMQRDSKEWLEICLQLTRFKKENKEYLNYLLFLKEDNKTFISELKKEIDIRFENLNAVNNYILNKMLRKILRYINKHLRFCKTEEISTEIWLYFCSKLVQYPVDIAQSAALLKLYTGVKSKIENTIPKLHEDLQYDYNKLLQKLP